MSTVRHLLCVSLLCAESTHALYSKEAENSFMRDPVEDYAAKILVWSAIIGIGLVLYTLVLVFRRRSLSPALKALLVSAIVMAPLLALSTGMLLVFVRAEQVEFCSSCHLTMKSYVEDMKNPKSEGLAAIHYKNRYIENNQCYECHTSYGINGTLEAKLAGIVDTYKYYARAYKFPLRMRKPYPNGDCLKCHAESVKWLSFDEHTSAKESLFSGEVKCQDCHKVQHPAHPIPESASGGSQ